MKKVLFNILFFILVIVWVCYIIFNKTGYLKVKELMVKEDKLSLSINNIEKQNVNISRKVARLNRDKSYIKYIIRHEFGYVSEDEVVVYIEE